jgi:hypothetical protein
MAANKKTLVTLLKLDDVKFNKGMEQAEANALALAGAAAAVGAAVLAAAQMTADYQDQTIKASRALGVTAEEMSALQHGAELSGVSFNALKMSMSKIAAPTAAMEKKFDKLGIVIRNNDGSLKSQTELLGTVADKMKATANDADKTAIAVDLFGTKGGELVNMLENGSEGLENFANQARNMGIIVSEEAGVAAEKYNDDMAVLQGSVKGLTMTMASSFIVWANQGKLMETLTGIVQSLTESWNELDDTTKEAIINTGALLVGLGALTGVFFALKIAAVAAWGAISGPIVLVAAGVAALGAVLFGLIDNWDKMTEEVEHFKVAIAPLGELFDTIKKSVADFKIFGDQVGDSTENVSILGTVAKVVFRVVVTWIDLLVTGFKIWIQAIKLGIDAIIDLGKIIYNIAKGDFSKAKEIFDQGIEGIRTGIVNIKNDALDLGGRLKKTFSAKYTVKIDPKQIQDATKSVQKLQRQVDTTVVQPKGTKRVKKEIKEIGDEWQKMFEAIEKGHETSVTAFSMALAKFVGEIAKSAKVFFDSFAQLQNELTQNMQDSLDAQMRNMSLFGKWMDKEGQKRLDNFIDSEKKRLKVLTETETERLRLMEESGEAELDALKDSEQKRIDALKDAENEKLRILRNATTEKLLLQDQEFQQLKNAEQLEHERRVEAARQEYELELERLNESNLTKEEIRQTAATMEASWNETEAMMEQAHLDNLDMMGQNHLANKSQTQAQADLEEQQLSEASNLTLEQQEAESQARIEQREAEHDKKMLEEEKASNARLEKQQKESDDKIAKMQEDKEERDKNFAKIQAFTKWRGDVAILQSTKGIMSAQTMAAGIAGAAQAFSALAPIPFIGPALGLAASTFILGATALSVQRIQLQQIPPPPELLLNTGGVLRSDIAGGPSAGDTIPASLTPGEAVLNVGQTNKFSDFIDNNMEGKQGLTIIIHNTNTGFGKIPDREVDIISKKLAYLVARKTGKR